MPENIAYALIFPSLLGVILIWLWPRKWTDKLCYPKTGDEQGQARTAILVLVVTLVMVTLLMAAVGEGGAETTPREANLDDVVGQAISWTIYLLPMLFALKADGLKWVDLQYRRSNPLPHLLLASLVAAIFLVFLGKAAQLPLLFRAGGLYTALTFLIVGFAEETFFRGYLQIRWVAAWGFWPGLLLASLIMSLFHVPILLLVERLSFFDTLLNVIRILPLSLMLGYGMHKSGNILMPAILHLWLNLLGNL